MPSREEVQVFNITADEAEGWDASKRSIEQGNWVFINGGMPSDLGFTPGFLKPDDPRPAAVQFNERYVFGGWRPQKGWTSPPREEVKSVEDLMAMHFPGDPPMSALAFCFLEASNEVVVCYPYGYVAILQEDDSFEMCRMD